MRQKAVSIAPQNEAPIQIAPTAATTPIVVELSRIRSTTRGERVLLGGREDALQVAQHARLDVGVLDHLAEDEQDQQREREQRQRQVVGDHRRQAGDVLAVGALPEDAQEPGRAASRGGAGLAARSALAPSSPAGPRSRGSRAGRRASPPRRPRRPRPRRCPRVRRRSSAAGCGSAPRSPLGGGSGGRLRRGARLAASAERRFGFAALAFAALGLAGPRSCRASRRGLRVPGRDSGRLPNTPPCGCASPRPRASSSLMTRIPSRSPDARVVIRRNRGRVAVFACRPASCTARLRAPGKAPQRARTSVDFEIAADYTSDTRFELRHAASGSGLRQGPEAGETRRTTGIRRRSYRGRRAASKQTRQAL